MQVFDLQVVEVRACLVQCDVICSRRIQYSTNECIPKHMNGLAVTPLSAAPIINVNRLVGMQAPIFYVFSLI